MRQWGNAYGRSLGEEYRVLGSISWVKSFPSQLWLWPMSYFWYCSQAAANQNLFSFPLPIASTQDGILPSQTWARSIYQILPFSPQARTQPLEELSEFRTLVGIEKHMGGRVIWFPSFFVLCLPPKTWKRKSGLHIYVNMYVNNESCT